MAMLVLFVLVVVASPAVCYFQCPVICRCVIDSFPTLMNCSHSNLRAFIGEIDPQINILDLSYNSIRWLPDSLIEYEDVQEINLSNNRIDMISNTTFKGLKSLKELDLSGNEIISLERIHGDTFVNNTPKLIKLNLSKNRIALGSRSDSIVLIKSPTLQNLDMSNCGLYDVSDLGFLSGLPKIRRLNLARNDLRWISGLVSETLLHLDVSRCKLDSIHPNALTSLPSLINLDVSRNEGFTFSSTTYSKSLKVLSARSSRIRLEILKRFPNLTYVDLRNNSITIIFNNTFNNTELRELHLSENNIGMNKIYPFNNLEKLAILNLAMNGISHLNWNTFSSNENLKILNLSNNALNTLVNFSIPSLVNLDVSHCHINVLQETFLDNMTSLVYLNLSDNKIENIPFALTSRTLVELNLAMNRLSTLTNATFTHLPVLKTLDLRGNRFTTPLQAFIFVGNTRLKSIKLENNPWICDCEDHSFLLLHRFLEVRSNENVQKVMCSSPSSLAGMVWQNACYEDWYPPTQESTMIQRYGVISIIVILCVGGAMIIISAVRRGLRERKMERRRREEEESRERALEVHEAMIRRHLENLSRESSPEMRGRSSRPRRTPSEITQPPSYEEALLMTRSQQDLLERGALYSDSNNAGQSSNKDIQNSANTSERPEHSQTGESTNNSRTLQRQESVEISDDSDSATESSRQNDRVP